MKTAFFATDCSVDSALYLRRWLAGTSHKATCLTVVHAYDIEAGTILTKETYRLAKQQAQARLSHWLAMLPEPWPGELKPETLLASPELAIKMHRLLRRYDIILSDDQAVDLPARLDQHVRQQTPKQSRRVDSDFAHQIAYPS